MKKTVALKQNHAFRRLYAKGKSACGAYLALYCRKNGKGVNRLGLTTGVKLGKAVRRNRVRRRMREIYRLHEGELGCGWDLVVVARVRAVYATYRELEREFLRLAEKLELKGGPGR